MISEGFDTILQKESENLGESDHCTVCRSRGVTGFWRLTSVCHKDNEPYKKKDNTRNPTKHIIMPPATMVGQA